MVYAPLNLPPALMAADSATVALRGAAGALTGTLHDPFAMPSWQRVLADLANRVLPVDAKKRLMRRISSSTARTQEAVESADSHLVARWMASLYPELPYPGAILGAPSGAAAHLASLLGYPLFSQHVLTGLRGNYLLDDTTAYVEAIGPSAARILRRNPDWEGIIHHDPLHDRFLVGTVGFLRLKYRRVPTPIREFLIRTLEPGATILVLDCGYPWLQTPLPDIDRSLWLQVGGLGDVPPEEFLESGGRIGDYRRSQGADDKPWGIPGKATMWQPESEWGTLPSFRDDAIAFAAEQGWNAVVLPFEHPDTLSRWVLDGFRALWPDPRSLYLDCFTHACPAYNRYARALPLWLPFIGKDSLRFAGEVLQNLDPLLPLEITLHPSFADPWDLATLAEWDARLQGRQVAWLGMDRDTWPTDLGVYGRYKPSLEHAIKTNGWTYDREALDIAEFLSAINAPGG